MENCPFCDTEIENRVLRQTPTMRVVLSNPRLVKGHILIIPKRHLEEPWEMNDQEALELFGLIRDLQPQLAKTIGSGCDLRQNYRPFIPQSKYKVDHIHYHLIPRTLNDEIHEKTQQFEKDVFTALSAEEAAEVRDILSL